MAPQTFQPSSDFRQVCVKQNRQVQHMASLSHSIDKTTVETVQKQQSNNKSKRNRGEKNGVKLTQHVALVVEQRHISH